MADGIAGSSPYHRCLKVFCSLYNSSKSHIPCSSSHPEDDQMPVLGGQRHQGRANAEEEDAASKNTKPEESHIEEITVGVSVLT